MSLLPKVFIVQHSYEREGFYIDDFAKIIGIYSSLKSAELAIEKMQMLPGFSNSPEGFSIDSYRLDEENWTEGFV